MESKQKITPFLWFNDNAKEAAHFYTSHFDDAKILRAAPGPEGQRGRLKDKFGLSWQIVPRKLGELLYDPDPEKAQRVLQAMLQMGKIDVAALQAACDGA
jgi:predicted 3-demethylubiquinone-9 3-methyltransferase (glyoxalase superfamily)